MDHDGSVVRRKVVHFMVEMLLMFRAWTGDDKELEPPAVTKGCLVEVRGAHYPLTWGLQTTPL